MSADMGSRAGKILAAIENKKYKARTIVGISNETEVPVDDVENLLHFNPLLRNKVMAVPGVTKNNHPLFVTTKRYKKETPLAVRVLNLIKDIKYF